LRRLDRRPDQDRPVEAGGQGEAGAQLQLADLGVVEEGMGEVWRR